jgi:hypothetical protein
MKFDSLKLFLFLPIIFFASFLSPSNIFAWKHFGFDGDFSLVYDENIFEFSDEDRDEFESGSNPNRFKGIESMDDFILIPDVSAYLWREITHESRSQLGFRFVPKFHIENQERDYQKYKGYLIHRLGQGNRFKVHYSHIPEYFVRNLLDFDLPEGSDRFRKAEFTYDAIGLDFLKIVNERISAKMGYAYEDKDYNFDFNERDLSIHQVLGKIILKIHERLKIHGEYQFETSEAKAQDADPAVDFDTSYDQHGFTIKSAYGLVKTLWVDLRYSFYYKNYTANHSEEEDPFHSGRDDQIHFFSVGLSKELNKHVECYIRYEFEVRDLDLDDLSVETLLDPAGAILGFDTNRVTVGSKIHF